MAEAQEAPAPAAARPSLVDRVTGVIAVAGGTLALVIAALVTGSILGLRLFDAPLPDEFELVKIATAISVFSYLPCAQARRSNIIVDTFTSRLPVRRRKIIDAFWDFVYGGAMAGLTYGLLHGTLDVRASGTTTNELQLPVWPSFALCLVLAAVTSLTAFTTAVRLLRRHHGPGAGP